MQEDRPTSNPLPPQSVAFAAQRREPSLSALEVLDKVAQETPNFGTEQACSILLFLLGQEMSCIFLLLQQKENTWSLLDILAFPVSFISVG